MFAVGTQSNISYPSVMMVFSRSPTTWKRNKIRTRFSHPRLYFNPHDPGSRFFRIVRPTPVKCRCERGTAEIRSGAAASLRHSVIVMAFRGISDGAVGCFVHPLGTGPALQCVSAVANDGSYGIRVNARSENNKNIISTRLMSASMADYGMTGTIVQNTPTTVVECKLYKRRWPMLMLFVLCSMANAVQWIQYSIISDVIMRFYNVESFAVDFTSIVYMVTYIPLIFPASWVLDKMGLRVAMVAGAFGTMIGAWVKVASTHPQRFFVTMIGQTIVASSQVFILNLPSRIAAVWFGPSEVSTACSVGVFGNQLGVALGFLLPPLLVPNNDNLHHIASSLSRMFYGFAIFSTLVFVLIFFFVTASPPLPPSLAQANQRSTSTSDPRNFVKSLLRLARNYGYILLLLSYGMNVGSFYAISTLLNQFILKYFPENGEDAGRIGLSIVFAGMLGSVVCGFILDKTHMFKETTLVVYGCSLFGMIVYTFTLSCGHISVVYMSAILLGFFMTGYLAVGYELAAELTYPESEGTSSGMLNAVVQVFGIVFTVVYGWIFKEYDDQKANLFLAGTLVLGTVLTSMIPPDLRRQAAQQKKSLIN